MVRWFKRDRSSKATKRELSCSFCHKKQDKFRKLIAGPNVYICDECVSVCVDIIADDHRMTGSAKHEPRAKAKPWVHDSSGSTAGCTLCGVAVPVEDALLVENRGVLCPGCIAAIQTAVAEQRERND
jgi:hypothetical protein